MDAKDILKAVLLDKNLNQKSLSNLSGFTETTISRWVNGLRDPKFKDICNVLKKVGYEIVIKKKS